MRDAGTQRRRPSIAIFVVDVDVVVVVPFVRGRRTKTLNPPPTQMGKRHLHVGVMNNCRAERLVNKEKRKEKRKEKPHKPEIGGRNRWRDEKRTDNGNENERVI